MTGEFTPDSGTGTPASLLKDIAVTPSPSSVYGTAYSYSYFNVDPYSITDGWVGPITITITATLKTSFLTTGSTTPTTHNLTVDVGSPTPLAFSTSFTVAQNSAINTLDLPGGSLDEDISTTSGNVKIKTNGGNGGVGSVGNHKFSSLPSSYSSLFDTTTSTNGKFKIATSTYDTVGDLFDVDLSGIENLVFPVDVTIHYNENLLPSGFSESDIRFLHYDETSGEWEDLTLNAPNNPNTGLNTITGRLTSLSPIVAGVNEDDEDSAPGSSGGSGGGGGGGSRGPVIVSWPPAQTQPESHFALFPLDKIRVASSAFINAAGISIAEGRINQQISVSGEFTNYQEVSQNYAFIVQVTDEEGFATDISWQESIIGSGSTSAISVLWTPETDGVYTVKIFVWDGISDTPQPLSSVTVKRINISE